MRKTLGALADATRLEIVELLGAGPRTVGEICHALSMEQPQVSKHLRVLRETGVVAVEVRAQSRIYSLRAAPLRELNEWLERFRSIWGERMEPMDEVVQELKGKEEDRRHGRRPRGRRSSP